MNLIGNWQKTTVSECGKKYPAAIQFKPNGLYEAQGDPKAAVHPTWDVGTFTQQHDTVSLSTSNDAVIDYQASEEADTLTFRDPEGCTVAYRRL